MTEAFLEGFGVLLAYFAVAATSALLVRATLKPPRELFRKTLHGILLFSLPVFLYAFPTWDMASLAAMVFVFLVYPLLAWGEKSEGYSELLTQRKEGEIKRSLVLVFLMFALIIGICWGWLGDRLLAAACIAAWGFGDAAAALVGKRYGRRLLEGRLIEGRKSLEGTLTMFAVAFLSVLIIMLVRGGLTLQQCMAVAALAAAATAAVELFTLGGFDTLTCPLAAASVIVPLSLLWEGLPL